MAEEGAARPRGERERQIAGFAQRVDQLGLFGGVEGARVSR